MNVDEILRNPAFSDLEPARVDALRGLMVRLQGKSTTETMAMVMDFMQRAPKGRDLTRAEQNAMAEAILSGLPEDDKNRFKSMLKILGM